MQKDKSKWLKDYFESITNLINSTEELIEESMNASFDETLTGSSTTNNT